MRPIREAYISQRQSNDDPYAKILKALPQDISSLAGSVQAIRLFPGKALGELQIDQALITEYGLTTIEGLRDRSFMIGIRNRKDSSPNQPDYLRFSQREQAELALVKPEWDGETLTYTAPGMDKLDITLDELFPRDDDRVHVEVISGEVIPAVVENGPITARIRQFLQQFRDDVENIDVLITSTWHQRTVDEKHRCNQPAETLFSDGGQQLLTSTSSLTFVNEQAQQRPRKKPLQGEILMNAIRPNIEVSGLPPNIEDIASAVTIHGRQSGTYRGIKMLFGDLCIRCSVTMVDNTTGKMRTDGEPLATFKEVRPLRLDGNKIPTFGVNTVFESLAWSTSFRKGDHVLVQGEKEVE